MDSIVYGYKAASTGSLIPKVGVQLPIVSSICHERTGSSAALLQKYQNLHDRNK